MPQPYDYSLGNAFDKGFSSAQESRLKDIINRREDAKYQQEVQKQGRLSDLMRAYQAGDKGALDGITALDPTTGIKLFELNASREQQPFKLRELEAGIAKAQAEREASIARGGYYGAQRGEVEALLPYKQGQYAANIAQSKAAATASLGGLDVAVSRLAVDQRKDSRDAQGAFLETIMAVPAAERLAAAPMIAQKLGVTLDKDDLNPSNYTDQALQPLVQGFHALGAKTQSGTVKAPTELQAKSAIFGARAEEADDILAKNPKASLLNLKIPGVGELGDNIVGRTFGGQSYNTVDQAKRNFINAVLRLESGAAIPDSEFANADKQYFPQVGDGPEVIAQKAANRRTAIDGINAAAGPHKLQRPPTPPPSSGGVGGTPQVNTPDEARKLPSGTQFRTPDGRLLVVP